MTVTAKDVARLSGVSTATVSRVINNDPRISIQTREKVLKTISKLDYKVNTIARGLKTNRTYTIGFICPEISNIFFMNIAKGVEDELRKLGYSVIVCSSNESIEEERERIKLMAEKYVDGAIIIPASDQGSHFNEFRKMNMPVVLADRLVSDFEADAVLVDNINGAYSAVEHLLNHGIRRIGFIGGDARLTSARERYTGYTRALQDYCVPFEEDIIKFGDFHTDSGYKLMKELMELEDAPRHVFISNYFMHMGATRYLIENKRNSKPDILIASFDDMELSSVLGYSCLRVAQPMQEIGMKVAQLLVERIAGKEKENHFQVVRLKTELIIDN